MILAVGTTLGVVVLSLCMVLPVARLGLRWRPTFRFTGDARRSVGGLAGVAIVTVAAQQIALFIAVRLANDANKVALYTFTVAQTVYLVPWSVFALPVAMSVYPSLATSAATGDDDGFRRTLAAATRTVTLLSAFGAAALIAAATPLGRLFAAIASSTRPDPGVLALTFAAFAPSLIGYGLFALHSRALYARGQNRYAAIATITGWGVVVAASFALAQIMPVHLRPAALAGAELDRHDGPRGRAGGDYRGPDRPGIAGRTHPRGARRDRGRCRRGGRRDRGPAATPGPPGLARRYRSGHAVGSRRPWLSSGSSRCCWTARTSRPSSAGSGVDRRVADRVRYGGGDNGENAQIRSDNGDVERGMG